MEELLAKASGIIGTEVNSRHWSENRYGKT